MADFITPVGRLVAGSFFDLNTRGHDGRELEPNKQHWFAALAFPKTAANWWEETGELGTMFQAVYAEGQAGYPNGAYQQPNFKWKIEDGDGKNRERTGYAGHWIVKFTRNESIDAVPVSDMQHRAVIDKMQAKRGYYYRIAGGCKANGATGDQAGVYMNMNMVQLCYAGEEIQTGPSAAAVFGGAPAAAMPAGAQAIGAAPQPQAPAMQPQAPAMQPQAPAMQPQAPAMQPQAPAMQPQAPAMQPQAPAAPAAPGVQPSPGFLQPPKLVMNPGEASYEQYLAAGWTDEQLIQHGKATMQ